MESDESKPPSPPEDSQNNELSKRLKENAERFQQCINDFFEELDIDEHFDKMTPTSYDKKKCYIRRQLLKLSILHNALSEQYFNLIEHVCKNCSSMLQNQLPESSNSNSSSQDIQMLADLCVSGLESSVNDDALKVKEEIKLCKGEMLSDFGLVELFNDDVLKVKEFKDSGSDYGVLLKVISKLNEEDASLKRILESLTDEIGELKLESEENITDVTEFKSESETVKEELKESKDTEISQLKDKLKEKCELVDELSEKMNKKDEQLEILWAEKRTLDIMIQQLKTRLDSMEFDKNKKLADESKTGNDGTTKRFE